MSGLRAGTSGHVAVVRLDGMGDVLLTGAAVRAVAGSASRVTMIVAPSQRATAGLLPGVDRVVGFAAGWVPLDPPPFDRRAMARSIRQIRRLRLSAVLIHTSFHQSPLPMALLLRLAGVPWIGAISPDYAGSLLDLRHQVPDELPEAERNLSLAEAAGFRPDARGARLALGPLPPAPSWLPPPPYVVLHPGASVPARRPSAATCSRLVAALAAAGRTVVVSGGTGERALTAEVAGTRGIDAGGRLRLPELAALLAGADAVVAPNTGPAHLAAAAGTPVVSLFAPVVPAERWQPYGVPIVLLGAQDAACRDTRARVCPVGHAPGEVGHPCLDSIDPQEVVTAVDALTSRPARDPASMTPLPEARR